MKRKLFAAVFFAAACLLTLSVSNSADAVDEAPAPRPVADDKKPDAKGKFGGFDKGKFGGGKFDAEKLKEFKGKFDPEKLKDLKGKFDPEKLKEFKGKFGKDGGFGKGGFPGGDKGGFGKKKGGDKEE